MTPRRIALTLAVAVTAALAGGAAPAAAAAQEDVCVTYDFAGSEVCVFERTGEAVEAARDLLRENDRCITYDFAGSEFCVVGDTIG